TVILRPRILIARFVQPVGNPVFTPLWLNLSMFITFVGHDPMIIAYRLAALLRAGTIRTYDFHRSIYQQARRGATSHATLSCACRMAEAARIDDRPRGRPEDRTRDDACRRTVASPRQHQVRGGSAVSDRSVLDSRSSAKL